MPAPDFISRAARFFVFAEQAFRFELDCFFWDLSTPLIVEKAIHLPVLTSVVRKTVDPSILDTVASCHLPAVLLPEAVPWHKHLVTAWEAHRTANNGFLRSIALRALVRLDGCGMPDGQERLSRLPEWLAEAQKTASDKWGDTKYTKLRNLAAWRPAPGVITPPETLRAWVDFWLEVGLSDDPLKKGIAAIALLNLPEADLRAASIPPMPAGELLRQLSEAIQVAADRTCKEYDRNYLPLLDWQPVTGTTWPVAEVKNMAQSWLEVTRHKEWRHRRDAWQQLIRWDRAGSLAICGMDLLPELVKALSTEESWQVLWEMAQWVPAAGRLTSTGTPGRRSLLQQLEGAWSWYRDYRYFGDRAAAWLAGIRLYQAGLSTEPPESFLQACISRVAKERNFSVMLILAQWSPGAEIPERWHREWHTGWQRRLLDKRESIRQAAAWALLHQSLEKEHGRFWRCAGLELWRAGTKVSPVARRILGAASSRLQQVRAHLTAGEVPKFEKKLPLPAERHRPPLALPPGRITGREWQMEHEKWNMENEAWRMQHQEVTVKPNHSLVPDRPFR